MRGGSTDGGGGGGGQELSRQPSSASREPIHPSPSPVVLFCERERSASRHERAAFRPVRCFESQLGYARRPGGRIKKQYPLPTAISTISTCCLGRGKQTVACTRRTERSPRGSRPSVSTPTARDLKPSSVRSTHKSDVGD